MINQLLKERTFQIARIELAPDTVNLPIPEIMEDAERETDKLLGRAKKGSTVYKLLKLQIKSFQQTKRFEKQQEQLRAQEKKLKKKVKKPSRCE